MLTSGPVFFQGDIAELQLNHTGNRRACGCARERKRNREKERESVQHSICGTKGDNEKEKQIEKEREIEREKEIENEKDGDGERGFPFPGQCVSAC